MDGQDIGHPNRINKEVKRVEQPYQFDFLLFTGK